MTNLNRSFITLDIDSKNKFFLSYVFLRSLFFVRGITRIVVNPSFSKGYHFTIWSFYPYSKKERLSLRLKLLDDKNRVRIDRLKSFGTDVFFSRKEFKK